MDSLLFQPAPLPTKGSLVSPLVTLFAQAFCVIVFSGVCLLLDRRSRPAGAGLIVFAITALPLLLVKVLLGAGNLGA